MSGLKTFGSINSCLGMTRFAVFISSHFIIIISVSYIVPFYHNNICKLYCTIYNNNICILKKNKRKNGNKKDIKSN